MPYNRCAFAVLLAAPLLLANSPAPETPPAEPQAAEPETALAVIETSMGAITVELETERAPVTANNFLRYADEKRFDGTAFYRSMHLDWGTPPNGLIQGGVQMAHDKVLPPIAHEPTSETGVLHKAGTLSMARYEPGTATADFSILLSDQPAMDADPASDDPEIRAGYAAFGQVVAGMEVVRAIFERPRSPTRGEGWMKGQMLEEPVKILTVRRATED
jgi:peptidyl-prolyl cis-trans isomerase A (cyclophilin A)